MTCQCVCHENKLNKEYEHTTECCKDMNGYTDWREELNKLKHYRDEEGKEVYLKANKLARGQAYQKGFEKGFASGSHETAEQAKEIHAVELYEARAEAYHKGWNERTEMDLKFKSKCPRKCLLCNSIK